MSFGSSPDSGGATTRASPMAGGVDAALAQVDQLKRLVADLEQELSGYRDPSSVGRDVARLRTWLSQCHQIEQRIASTLGITLGGGTDTGP